MKITLKEWLELEAKVKAAREAVQAAALAAKLILSAHMKAGNNDEAVLLMNKIAGPIDLAADTLPSAYLLHPQSEWTGGDSNRPKNHAIREPHYAGLFPRRFTAEEVAEAGLVNTGGPGQWEKPPKPE